MTRTEKIIADFDGISGKTTSLDLIAECRRLSRLCGAYWAEIEAWRERTGHKFPAGWFVAHGGTRMEEADATDAARREAGEGQ